MTKDIIDAVRERRSVHRFESRPIPEATLGRILECGRLAPSVAGSEPWLFVVVENEAKRQALAGATAGEAFIAGAPAVVAVCVDLERAVRAAGAGTMDPDKASLLGVQDVAAAVENMLLAATGFGLGSCWVGDFDPAAVAKVLELDHQRYNPLALVPVGYAVEWPEPPEHRPMDEIVRIIH